MKAGVLMCRESHREWVGRFRGSTKAGECPDTRIGESFANCSTPTAHDVTNALVVASPVGHTDVVVVTVAQNHNISHLSPLVERFSIVVRDFDRLEEYTEVLDVDLGVVCRPSASCVQDQYSLRFGDHFDIDERLFAVAVRVLDDGEGRRRQPRRFECGL